MPRVAVDDARPRVVAELPAGAATVSDVLAGLLEVPVDELLLVLPAGRRPADVEIPLTVARTARFVASAEAAQPTWEMPWWSTWATAAP